MIASLYRSLPVLAAFGRWTFLPGLGEIRLCQQYPIRSRGAGLGNSETLIRDAGSAALYILAHIQD